MSALRKDIDPEGLLEFSVVYTDRALNHMSAQFQQVMKDLSFELKSLFQADAVAIVPGSGTAGMEAVARALAAGQDTVIVRNGWFSYRWTQILEAIGVAKSSHVFKAHIQEGENGFVPADIDEVTAYIKAHRPGIVFAPHVETASGMMLSDEYIRALAEATHSVGGLLVIDCIASGCIWLDMKALGIDVLLSAPQKGLSSTPCAGLVMLSEAAKEAVLASTPSSFSLDLKAWLNIMSAYENGGHAYHATMPTDGLKQLRDTLLEAKQIGYDTLKQAQITLGQEILAVLNAKGVQSVADPSAQAYGVIVCHASSDEIHKGAAFAKVGVQIAAGTPLQVDEPSDYKSFRIGLFGLDKLTDVKGTVERFKGAADQVFV
ncbi:MULTISPECIES: aminotransferase class V-fold PLP-dependent enzyme [Moraxella]|uniref:Serine-pyruvate aminotransferase/archaeal aspartate aminotransferase n=1 Tax=Moraxella catarrhalis TaxID=480 RepID=A0A7Z0UWX4_MORCA|nr:aminotransferase class V-fold PLP-dependent enzyme [Moraxella catarrhalis]OAU99405.1 Serine-pyruvate aminotransferase/archaeal aspartate aminotransferase [Moraxella catarrhalis]STY81091.1 Soluble hydrogenase 42 kDa subunit [Moraxella catarrhalis]